MTGLVEEKAHTHTGGGCCSWVGSRVRRGEREGVVVGDEKVIFRTLTIKYNDNGEEQRVCIQTDIYDRRDTSYEYWLERAGGGGWVSFCKTA